jgi:hypothetical protein
LFNLIGQELEQTQTDPKKRETQVRRYEQARVNMWAAINRRDSALAVVK